MKLGDIANAEAVPYGKPLEGVRILAVEQMQALPFGTQMLARFGADVVKVEHPVDGESGRHSTPAMKDPWGRPCGATFLRNNLDKRSIGIDLKHPRGKELLLALVPHYDVVCENFKAGTMDRLGLGWDVISTVSPRTIYLSVNGFGAQPSPYDRWPAYAGIAEAMSGAYEWKRAPGTPPVANPMGGLGDIGSAVMGVIGVLTALRHRDRTGEGQRVDISMFDAMVAFTDIVTNAWSMGQRQTGPGALIIDGFQAKDGWFIMQVGREHQFQRLCQLIGTEEWLTDPRFATRQGWRDHLADVIRPAVEAWASTRTKVEACDDLANAGIAAGPCFNPEEVIHDPHVAARNMLVELPRTDGVEDPVLIPGNPVKLSKVAEGPEVRPPWIGEHTEDVLRADLGLSDDDLASLRADGVIN
jgi:crotonobetainyl-CoA:carnitine CoA-transferase CaiB-like acyl-CoA transferase